jgi:hypothetical protein
VGIKPISNSTIKVDNKSLAGKLALRRAILNRFPTRPLKVLDCFAGEGRLWETLKREYEVEAYVPIDTSPRQAGTLPGDAMLLVRSVGVDQFNVIDVDSYGEPWGALFTCLPLIGQPTCLFATHGYGKAFAWASSAVRRLLGIPRDWKIPHGKRLIQWHDDYLLRKTTEFATIVNAARVRGKNVDYFGLHAEPAPVEQVREAMQRLA